MSVETNIYWSTCAFLPKICRMTQDFYSSDAFLWSDVDARDNDILIPK